MSISRRWKIANITLVHKKTSQLIKKTTDQSVLPLLSKVVEGFFNDQLYDKPFIMLVSESSFHSTCSFQTFASMKRRIR